MSTPRGWGDAARPRPPAPGTGTPSSSSSSAAAPPSPPPGSTGRTPGLGDLVDAVVGGVRRIPRVTWAVSAVVVLALGAVQLLLTRVARLETLLDDVGTGGDVADLQEQARLLLGQAVGSVGAALLGVLATTVVVAITARSLAHPGVRPVWSGLRPGGLTGLVLVAVATLGAAALVPPLALGALAALTGSPGATAAGVVLGALVSLVLLFRLAPVVVLALPVHATSETRGPGASLRHAADLVAGERWRLVGVWLLTVIVLGIASGVVSAPFTGLGSLVMPAHLLLWSTIGSVVASAVTTPIGALVLATVHAALEPDAGPTENAAG